MNIRKYFSALLFASLFLAGQAIAPANASGGTVRYVKPSPSGTGSCTSWANSCGLQHALGLAIAGDQLWVEQGTYKPGGVPSSTFTLKNGVAIYGGFAGTETLLSQRNPAIHAAILSGDIGIAGTFTDNVYHVVQAGSTDSTAVLDGFIIAGGDATGSYPDNRGGGLDSQGKPTLSNLSFSANVAAYGAGMYNLDGNPTLTNVTFDGNQSTYGGAMYNEKSSPTLNNVTFSSNSAINGGALYNYNTSSPVLTNVTFSENTASAQGGGIVSTASSNPTLTNVTFVGNYGASGRAVYSSSSSNPSIFDSIFWDGGSEFFDVASPPTIADSVVAGGCPSGASCTGALITSDPLLGPLANNGGFTQTMALSVGSAAIDAGNNSTCASTDQRGVTRPQGPACDIGAYEAVVPVVSSVTRADPNLTRTASVHFAVKFSESVIGVDVSDFSLTTTGVSGSSVTGVSGSGTTYMVNVNTGSHNDAGSVNDTIRLDVVDDDSITDGLNQPLGGAGIANGDFTTGQVYTVLKSMTFRSSGFQDGWVLESGESTSVGGVMNSSSGALYLGDSSTRKQYRSILSFSTAPLPDNAVISSVKLRLKYSSVTPAATHPISLLGGILLDMRKGFLGTSSALQVGDFQAPANKTVGPFSPALSRGYYTLNLGSGAFPYINRLTASGGLTQIRLRFKLDDNNDSFANILSLVSGNNATASYRPTWIIAYTTP